MKNGQIEAILGYVGVSFSAGGESSHSSRARYFLRILKSVL